MANINRKWASGIGADGNPVYAPKDTIDVCGRTVLGPKDKHYEAAGYKRVVDAFPSDPAPEGYHYEARGYAEDGNRIWRVYETVANPPAPPRVFSKLKCVAALMEAGIDSFKIEGRMKSPEYVRDVTRIWRRLIVIPFNAKIEGRSDIKNFGDYLYHNAGESILAWIIEGAKKVIDANYKVKLPVCVQKAIDEYRNQNDWFTHFLEDKCEVDPTYREGSNTLYQAYRNYCQDTNEYVRSTTDFYFALEKAGFQKLVSGGRKFIKGLRLKLDDGDFEDFLQ